jgi:hypothetical protein
VYVRGAPLKFSKGTLFISETTQGLVRGRVMGGSAVAGLEEPTCGVGGTGTTCAGTTTVPIERMKRSFEMEGRIPTTCDEANALLMMLAPLSSSGHDSRLIAALNIGAADFS